MIYHVIMSEAIDVYVQASGREAAVRVAERLPAYVFNRDIRVEESDSIPDDYVEGRLNVYNLNAYNGKQTITPENYRTSLPEQYDDAQVILSTSPRITATIRRDAT